MYSSLNAPKVLHFSAIHVKIRVEGIENQDGVHVKRKLRYCILR